MKAHPSCHLKAQQLHKAFTEVNRCDGLIKIFAAILFLTNAAHAGTTPQSPQIGDSYEIKLVKDSAQRGSNGSSGSAHDQDKIIERVMGVRANGLELQYDLPDDAKKEERTGNWQFPFEVFKPFAGPPQLLNRSELEARIDSWLKTAKLSRSDCGHWIFTWNAFRIECDPQSVLKTFRSYDLRSVELHEGAVYQDPEASSPGKLTRKLGGLDGESFVTDLPVDSDAVRRTSAESDVVVGEILKKPVSLEAALHEHAAEQISGTISVVFDTDTNGNARRRVRVTKLEIKRPDGGTETQTVTETLERRLISRRD